MSKITSEMMCRVWNDDEGVAVRVAEDRDALCMVEIRPDDKVSEEYFGKFRVAFPPEFARAVAHAMLKVADDIDKRDSANQKAT